MNRIGIAKIENAFLPSSEFEPVERFAGRAAQVNQAYAAMQSKGAHLAVTGARGMGKTALARQIIRLASGDNSLLSKLEIPHDGELDFISVYFACGSSVHTFSELLLALLTAPGSLLDWAYDVPAALKEIRALAARLNAQAAPSARKSPPPVTAFTIETVFAKVVMDLLKEKIARDGLLIVVDDFDKLDDLTGCADFLKALSANVPDLRFCLAGAAASLQELMKARPSSAPPFPGSVIDLPPMTKDELAGMLDAAAKSIRYEISFTEGAKTGIANLSKGHPRMAQLLGKYTLRAAYISHKDSVDAKDIEHASKRIADMSGG